MKKFKVTLTQCCRTGTTIVEGESAQDVCDRYEDGDLWMKDIDWNDDRGCSETPEIDHVEEVKAAPEKKFSFTLKRSTIETALVELSAPSREQAEKKLWVYLDDVECSLDWDVWEESLPEIDWCEEEEA